MGISRITEDMLTEADRIIKALNLIVQVQEMNGFIPAIAIFNLKRLRDKLNHAIEITNHILE